MSSGWKTDLGGYVTTVTFGTILGNVEAKPGVHTDVDGMPALPTEGFVADPVIIGINVTIGIQHLAARLVPVRNEGRTKELLESVECFGDQTFTLFDGCISIGFEFVVTVVSLFHTLQSGDSSVSELLLLLNKGLGAFLEDELDEEPGMLDTIFWVGIVELVVSFLDILIFTDVEGDSTLLLGGIFVLLGRDDTYGRYTTLFGDISSLTLSIGEGIG